MKRYFLLFVSLFSYFSFAGIDNNTDHGVTESLLESTQPLDTIEPTKEILNLLLAVANDLENPSLQKTALEPLEKVYFGRKAEGERAIQAQQNVSNARNFSGIIEASNLRVTTKIATFDGAIYTLKDWDQFFVSLSNMDTEGYLVGCMTKDVHDLPPQFRINKYVLFSEQHSLLMAELVEALNRLNKTLNPTNSKKIDEIWLQKVKDNVSAIKTKLDILRTAIPPIEGPAPSYDGCAFGFCIAAGVPVLLYIELPLTPGIVLTSMGCCGGKSSLLISGSVLLGLGAPIGCFSLISAAIGGYLAYRSWDAYAERQIPLPDRSDTPYSATMSEF